MKAADMTIINFFLLGGDLSGGSNYNESRESSGSIIRSEKTV